MFSAVRKKAQNGTNGKKDTFFGLIFYFQKTELVKNYFFAWSKLGAFGVILTMQLEPPKTEYKAGTTWINSAKGAEAKSQPNLLRGREGSSGEAGVVWDPQDLSLPLWVVGCGGATLVAGRDKTNIIPDLVIGMLYDEINPPSTQTSTHTPVVVTYDSDDSTNSAGISSISSASSVSTDVSVPRKTKML